MKTPDEFLRSMIGDLVIQVAMLRAQVAELEGRQPPPAVKNGKAKEAENAPDHRPQ